jgi:glycosyltransferase involved in cell wall biosynthesis
MTLKAGPSPKHLKYSAVIPVFNSAAIVGKTIRRTVAFFEEKRLDYELLVVNDGSSDGSWEVLQQKALENPRIMAINLLKDFATPNAQLAEHLGLSLSEWRS